MLSIRSSRIFHGDAPISLRAVAQLEQRPFPVSLREMAFVDSATRSGRLAAGDVSVDYVVTLWNTGDWFLSGTFSDDGWIVGDTFELQVLFDVAGDIGVWLDGQIGAGDTRVKQRAGSDVVVRERWSEFRNASATARLEVTSQVGSVVVGGLFTVFVALALGIGAVVEIVGGGGSTGRIETSRCTTGEQARDLCYEVRHVDGTK